jgi:hypothetical protein
MVQLLPWGSNINQLVIPVQENRRGVESLSQNITNRSYLRECQRLRIRKWDDPSATFFEGVFVDLRYRELPEQQEKDEALSLQPEEHQDADAMSVDSDGMSIGFFDSDEMDTMVFMDYVDTVGDLVERFTHLKLGVDFFESFFTNTALDEKGRVVCRSPCLGGATGSFFVTKIFIQTIEGGSLVNNACNSTSGDGTLLRV